MTRHDKTLQRYSFSGVTEGVRAAQTHRKKTLDFVLLTIFLFSRNLNVKSNWRILMVIPAIQQHSLTLPLPQSRISVNNYIVCLTFHSSHSPSTQPLFERSRVTTDIPYWGHSFLFARENLNQPRTNHRLCKKLCRAKSSVRDFSGRISRQVYIPRLLKKLSNKLSNWTAQSAVSKTRFNRRVIAVFNSIALYSNKARLQFDSWSRSRNIVFNL